jgi:predicted TIM-barrel fold metal-dependent hydrolase
MDNDFALLDEVQAIRSQLNHPVIDGDGHLTEHVPLLLDFVEEELGRSVAEHVRRTIRTPVEGRPPATMWGTPAKNTLDRATSVLPELLNYRLDQFGIDYALLYPGLPLVALSMEDPVLRRGAARGANRYYAEVFGPYSRRMQAVAAIPAFTPEEAIEELDYAVGTLGLKAVMFAGLITEQDANGQTRIRSLGHGSPYDYDPVWRRCQELRVVPTFHTPGRGLATRASPSNYVFNHLGHFAWAQEAICRSLIFGGVPKRFPDLRFAFLEGGVGWGCQLFADMVSHYEKRNRSAMPAYDPGAVDLPLYDELFVRYGPAAMQPSVAERRHHPAPSPFTVDEVDDFREALIGSPEDIVDMFTRQFYFGCEGDDPLTAVAFDRRILPEHSQMRPIFASDIGHWEVPDMRYVLAEAWEHVEHETLDAEQFEAFTFGNVAEMLTSARPDFFQGTVVEEAVAAAGFVPRETVPGA